MEITLPVYQVEIAAGSFLLRSMFQPRGDMLVFLNDQAYSHIRFDDVELHTLTADYQVPGFSQPYMSVNKDSIHFVSILKEEHAELLQVLRSKRPVVFYTEWCAIRGDLHVNGDLRDDDLLERTHDFFAISKASIFPTKSLTKMPSRSVPYLLVNRHKVLAYHVHKTE